MALQMGEKKATTISSCTPSQNWFHTMGNKDVKQVLVFEMGTYDGESPSLAGVMWPLL